MHSIADAHNLAAEEQELIRAAAANQGVFEVVKRVETQRLAVIAGRKTAMQALQEVKPKVDELLRTLG